MGLVSSRGNQVTKFQEGLDVNTRDSYINTESSLQFTKANSHYLDCSNDSRFDFDQTTSFSISFFCKKNIKNDTHILISKFDGTTFYIIQFNAGRWDFTLDDGPVQKKILLSNIEDIYWHHIVAIYDSVVNMMYLYRDSKLIGSLDTTGLGDFSNTTALTVGGRPVNPFFSDTDIAEVTIHNKALSPDEIEFINNNIILPESTHENVVSHHPLNERYAYNDGVDNLFFDVVEQYNYAKVTPLTAIHAKAINFTDGELGIVNPSSEVVKKDFYNKGSNNWGVLNFLDTGDKLTFASNTDWDHIVYEGTATLTLNIAGLSIDASAIGNVNWLEIQDSGNNVLTRLNFNEFQGTNVIDIVGGNNAALSGWTADETKTGGGAWTEKTTGLPSIIQGFNLSSNSMEIPSFFSSATGYTFLFDILFPNPNLTADQEWLRVNVFNDPNLVIRNNSSNDILRLDITNGAGLKTFTPTIPNGIQGIYNQISQFAFSSDGVNNVSLTKTFNYNGTYQAMGSSGSVVMPNLGTYQAIFFARNTTPQFPLEATIFRVRVYDFELNRLQFLKNFNNSLLSNLINNPVGDYQFNEGSFYENGVNVLVRNYGTGGGSFDGVFRGLTGATSADQLADVPNHLSLISSLR